MLDKIKKIDKLELIKYSVIFTITLLLCSGFLQMHFSSDTYVLYDLGYMKYPSEYFLLDRKINFYTSMLYWRNIKSTYSSIYNMYGFYSNSIYCNIYILDK